MSIVRMKVPIFMATDLASRGDDRQNHRQAMDTIG